MYPKIVEHEFSSFLMIFQSLATPLTLTYFICTSTIEMLLYFEKSLNIYANFGKNEEFIYALPKTQIPKIGYRTIPHYQLH